VALTSDSSPAQFSVQSTFNPRFWRVALWLSALSLIVHLGYSNMWNPDEGRYASASLEMIRGFEGRGPDWVVPYLNTIPRLNKPPLVYWVAGTFMTLLGPNETAARLGSALAALGVMGLLWYLGRIMFGPRVALLGAIVWATALFPFGLARTLNTDMLLCFAITLAITGIWQALERGRWTQDNGPDVKERFDFKPALIAGIGMGLALLAKGPVGMALPLLIGFVYLFARNWRSQTAIRDVDGNRQFLSAGTLMVSRTWRDLGRDKVLWLSLLSGALLAVAIAIPWYLAVSQREPEFLQNFFINENLGRFSGGTRYHGSTPIWYYVPVVLIALVPWTPFLLWTGPQRGSHAEPQLADYEDRSRRFLWVWAMLPVLLFSVSSTKLVTYILPAFPAFCLLIGQGCSRVWARDDGDPSVLISKRLWWLVTGTTVALLLFMSVLLSAYLLTNKTVPRSEGLLMMVPLLMILLGGAGALAWAARRRQGSHVVAAVWGCSMLLHVYLLPSSGYIGKYEDSSALTQSIAPYVKPEDRFVLYRTFQPTAMFYLQRPVEIVDFENNSGLDDAVIARSKYFLPVSDGLLAEILRSPQRTYVLIKWNGMPKTLLQPSYVIGVNNDYRLISNRPAPEGYAFEKVAPKKRERLNGIPLAIGTP
jgi:4-amino-4-deoxy-L-arabinose transferase-like glycosyltransferase